MVLRSLTICLLAGAAFAQAPAARPSFEVASIKPSEPLQERVNVGIHIDGAQVHVIQFSLKDLIQAAYRVKIYQVEGPDWIASERFDVSAKIPEGVSRDQVPEMLQSLLEDRFALKVHRGSKDLPVYALVVEPGGPKMQESPADPEGTAPCKTVTDVKAAGGRGGVNVNYGCGSYFAFGNNQLEGKKLTMPLLCDILGRFTDRPVIDATGLTARYDFVLKLSEEDYNSMLIRSALAAGVTLPPQALQFLNATQDSLNMALRRLGLKFDSRKAPQEMLLVDSIRKTPTEN